MQAKITGNTYPVKDALKALGAKWDADSKCWTITSAKLADAQKIVADAPAEAPRVPGKCSKCGKSIKEPYTICLDCKPAPRKCRECGATPNLRGWPRIYKNGVCSDCYRDEREEREMGY
jgi:hypothetical protein